MSRSKMLIVRADDEEKALVRELADEDGVTISDLVRTLIRAEYLRRARAKARPTSKTK